MTLRRLYDTCCRRSAIITRQLWVARCTTQLALTTVGLQLATCSYPGRRCDPSQVLVVAHSYSGRNEKCPELCGVWFNGALTGDLDVAY